MAIERTAPVEPVALDQVSQLEEARRPIFRLLTPTEAILLMILPLVGELMGRLAQIVEMLGLGMILTAWAAPRRARVALSDSASSGRFS